MNKLLEAIYEQGVFRPLGPVDLREHQRVTLTIAEAGTVLPEEEWLDHEYLQRCAGEADRSLRLDTVRAALSKIAGSLTDAFSAERDER